MHRRIRLAWERNQDAATEHYHVYRSTRGEVNRQDTLVMVVQHPTEPTPVSVIGERLTRIADGLYKLKHGQILSLAVRVNGVPAAGLIDPVRGTVKLEGANRQDDVVADYTFDGIEMMDDDRKQPGVTYYGPVAMDRGKPPPITKIQLRADPVTNRAALTWALPPTPGVTFDYRIEAVGGRGQYSRLSLRASVHMSASLAHVPYLVERSRDRGKSWEVVSESDSSQYVENYVDTAMPGNVRFIQVDAQPSAVHQTRGRCRMTWQSPLPDRGTYSAMYRVSVRSELGEVSPPSPAVGPILMKTGLKEIVIRRKVFDGSYPTLTGTDAVTVATLAAEVTEFLDDALPDRTKYAYSVYTIDHAGNYAIPTLFTVELGDFTAPEPVVIVDVRQLEL